MSNRWHRRTTFPTRCCRLHLLFAASSLFFLGDGLLAKNSEGTLINLSLRTPYLTMGCSQATLLPDNQVVFQLDMEQIVLFDLDSRQIGLITRGRSPVVVFENPPANPNQ